MLCIYPSSVKIKDTPEEKMANLRAAYGFFMGHPGKKLMFMGHEFGHPDTWTENKGLDWNVADEPLHAGLSVYVRDLNQLYCSRPALYEMDYEPEGFEWINCTYEKENIVIFQRRGRESDASLVFVCSFLPDLHKQFRIGVPAEGVYRELLNSDAREYGGSGVVNEGRIR